jgi:hypothetical protein
LNTATLSGTTVALANTDPTAAIDTLLDTIAAADVFTVAGDAVLSAGNGTNGAGTITWTGTIAPATEYAVPDATIASSNLATLTGRIKAKITDSATAGQNAVNTVSVSVNDTFNLVVVSVLKAAPTPAFTVTAAATSLAPVAGAANSVTLTVKNSDNETDTTFTGAHNVSVSGFTAAPDSSYGNADASVASGSSIASVSVTFTDGVATVALKVNKAGSASNIVFSVTDVATPAASALAITPVAAAVDSLEVATDAVLGIRDNENPVAMATQPIITLKDAFENVCATGASATASVIVAISGSTTPSGAALAGTTTVAAVNGVATFTDLTVAPGSDAQITDLNLSFTSGAASVAQNGLSTTA